MNAPYTSEAIVVSDRAQALAAYPHARKVGPFVFVSGVSSRRFDNTYAGVEITTDENGNEVVKLDAAAQTRAVIENIGAILEKAGGSLKNVVDLTVFLVNMNDYAEMNKVYNEFFDQQSGPSRTTVAVKQLPGKHLLIEIKATAYLP
ncbi:Endoribonuclease L-PSP [Ramicandelaber brevisporus]|nr:Endoribonuclease L-PSP [Ramicandelaber brevisporus]